MLFIDATGVGSPIIDLLVNARVKAVIRPVCFTRGDRRTEVDGEIRLGKAFLVSRLKALMQSGLLHLPATADSEAMKGELLNYEIHIDANANDTYGAFKVGSHDDQVTAVGLAVQTDSAPLPWSWRFAEVSL